MKKQKIHFRHLWQKIFCDKIYQNFFAKNISLGDEFDFFKKNIHIL